MYPLAVSLHRNKISMSAMERCLVTLDVEGLPVVRQWFVLSRKDKVLMPPARAMLEFLSANGAQFLPRAHGRIRLTRPSVRVRRR